MNNVRRSVLGKCFWLIVVIACTVIGIRRLCSIDIDDKGTGGGGNITGGEVSPQPPTSEDVKKQQEIRKLELEKTKLRTDVEARHAKFRGDVDAIVEKYRKNASALCRGSPS